LSGDYLLI
jgi:hypothetical protein